MRKRDKFVTANQEVGNDSTEADLEPTEGVVHDDVVEAEEAHYVDGVEVVSETDNAEVVEDLAVVKKGRGRKFNILVGSAVVLVLAAAGVLAVNAFTNVDLNIPGIPSKVDKATKSEQVKNDPLSDSDEAQLALNLVSFQLAGTCENDISPDNIEKCTEVFDWLSGSVADGTVLTPLVKSVDVVADNRTEVFVRVAPITLKTDQVTLLDYKVMVDNASGDWKVVSFTVE